MLFLFLESRLFFLLSDPFCFLLSKFALVVSFFVEPAMVLDDREKQDCVKDLTVVLELKNPTFLNFASISV